MTDGRTFDIHLEQMLNGRSCSSTMKSLWSKYQLATQKLESEVLSWIAKAEPNLTDHGILHIQDVMENAARLLGLDSDYDPSGDSKPFSGVKIRAVEAFVLGVALRFHDCGNILGRIDHPKTGVKVLKELTENMLELLEIRVIGQVMSAHSGMAQNGSSDTIGNLPEIEYLAGEPVNPRPIAAVLRLADELAEGPQRTSSFINARGGFTVANEVESDGRSNWNMHHYYASITHVSIDRGNRRIALRYLLDLDDHNFKVDSSAGLDEDRLRELLQFIFMRIRKTDEERRYARFYGESLLGLLDTTDIALEFYRDNQLLELGLDRLIINDLVVPGSHIGEDSSGLWITQWDESYEIDNILGKVL